MTTLDLGRDITGDFEAAARREWLVTNGIGGFASGTVAGVNTRRYHIAQAWSVAEVFRVWLMMNR